AAATDRHDGQAADPSPAAGSSMNSTTAERAHAEWSTTRDPGAPQVTVRTSGAPAAVRIAAVGSSGAAPATGSALPLSSRTGAPPGSTRGARAGTGHAEHADTWAARTGRQGGTSAHADDSCPTRSTGTRRERSEPPATNGNDDGASG